MLTKCSAAMAFALLVPLTGAAAQAAPEPPMEAVEITGVRDPDWKPYRAFLKGLDAFDAQHALAPRAALRFLLAPSKAGVPADGITLRIAGNETSIPVAIAADHTFVLPRSQAAADDNAELMLNKKKNLYRWGPDIRSPDVPANARRLGDLRLECQVRWAVEKTDLPFFRRTLFSALGGPCATARVDVRYQTLRPLAAAHLVFQERRVALPLFDAGGRRMYSPPLYDSGWPDDTLVELEFEGQEAP